MGIDLKKNKNCIQLPLGGYDSMRDYNQYVSSHKWKTERDADCFYEVCERCGATLQNPSGTLAFRFACIIMVTS